MYEEVMLNADCRAITTSLLAFDLLILFLLGRHVNRFIVEAAYRLILLHISGWSGCSYDQACARRSR